MNEIGTRFVFASDEFYAITDEPLPKYGEYEGFPQLENGVGLLKTFEHSVDEELSSIDEKITLNNKYIIATGTLAEGFMNKIKNKILKKFIGLELKVIAIENNFFGKSITVSGLVTGQDIISQLEDYKDVDGIIIPKSMLRTESNVFLDDLTIKDIENRLKVKIIPVEVSGREFVDLFKRG